MQATGHSQFSFLLFLHACSRSERRLRFVYIHMGVDHHGRPSVNASLPGANFKWIFLQLSLRKDTRAAMETEQLSLQKDTRAGGVKSSLFTSYDVCNELLNSMGGLYDKYTVYRAYCSTHSVAASDQMGRAVSSYTEGPTFDARPILYILS